MFSFSLSFSFFLLLLPLLLPLLSSFSGTHQPHCFENLGTDTTQQQLEEVLNVLLENSEKTPYAFYINAAEIMSNLHELFEAQKLSTESTLEIKYEPLSVFRVHPVTRCTHTMPGHIDAVLKVAFSPDGQHLASGGGDTVVRLWDVFSGLPRHTKRSHKHHVLALAWSPDCSE